ncbi:MAG TPA: PAS domain S-box protein [Terriglobia bacterium]|nr:PAS domain S-box protein [Terriglobia bacterium]
MATAVIVVFQAGLGYGLRSSPVLFTYTLIPFLILLSLVMAILVLNAARRARDITERKQAEEELRASEERFRTLIEMAPVAIGIARHGVTVYANRKYLEIYGYSQVEEIKGKSVADYWAPESRPEIEEFVRQRANGLSAAEEHEGIGLRKDGSQFPVHVAVKVVQLADGAASFGFFWDLTERQQAERALTERERQLVEAQRLAGVGSWEWDVKTAAVTWSRELYKLAGFDPDQSWPDFQKEYHAIYPPETWARLDAAGRETMKTGAPFEVEGYINVADGTKKWIISRGAVDYDADRQPVRLRGTVQDITERKRAEEALRDSEERYRLLFERNFAGVTRTTLDGRVLECNQSFARIYGYDSIEEVLPLNVRDFYYEDSGRDEFLNRLMKEKVVVGYEYRARRKDGKSAWVLISSSLIEEEKQGTTILSTVLDITRWRELGEQLRQAQKMDAVGRLAGGVAHDFNNMLQIINGYSELLLDELPAQDPSRDLVKEIKNSVDRSASLTRQLLAFSRQQVMTPEIVDLNKVIINSNKMVRRLIGEHIELISVEGVDLSRVRVDSGRIDQVILNLAVNARDAMPDGGRLTVETANVQVDEDFARGHIPMTPGPYVMLKVSDTGCGMDADTKIRIFEPFFTTKEKGKGTGLGLATVYGIIKQSGGYVWVESELGQGTAFTIYFPPSENAIQIKEATIEAEILGGSETVLIVEDEKDIRWLMRKAVEAKGYTVLEAHDGTEALHVAEQHPGAIHLLLTDMVMPGISGRALADQLADRRPELKVLYMSGYTGDSLNRQDALELGAAFLQKPFAPDSLARKVREVLDAQAG